MSSEQTTWLQFLANHEQREAPSSVAESVKREFPELDQEARAHDAKFLMSRPSSITGGPPLLHHTPVRVFAGWSATTFVSEVWSVVGAVGSSGFRRITGRLDALAEVLRADMDRLGPDSANVLAELVRAAAWPLEKPPAFHQSVVTAWTRGKIDANEQGYPNIDDVEAWRRIRDRLVPPFFDGTTLEFSHVDSFERDRFRFTSWSAQIDRATGAVRGKVEDVATLAGRQRAFPMIGRPYVVEGAQRVAPLVARDDWADVDG